MKIRTLQASLLVIALVACSSEPKTGEGSQLQKLLARDAAWSEVASEGKDIDKIVSYWAADAVVIPEGAPVVEGRDAIRAYITEGFKDPNFHIQWSSSAPHFSSDGKMAWMRGDSQVEVSGPDGKPMKLRGRGVTIWRLDADGEWRCVVDTWNFPAAETAAAAPKKT